jgi:hypothetical protein
MAAFAAFVAAISAGAIAAFASTTRAASPLDVKPAGAQRLAIQVLLGIFGITFVLERHECESGAKIASSKLAKLAESRLHSDGERVSFSERKKNIAKRTSRSSFTTSRATRPTNSDIVSKTHRKKKRN